MLNYHEFHVSSAGRFRASQRDLLTQISSGHDLLGERDTIILQKDQLQAILDNGIIVDHTRHIRDQLDDLLGHVVAGRRLATDHDHARIKLAIGILAYAIVQGDYVQHIQQLTLVLVYALYLYVEHRARVYFDLIVFFNVLSKLHLVLLFHLHERI